MWQKNVNFAGNKVPSGMKRILLLALLALTIPAAAAAQNIALGERAPEIRPAAWLAGRQPAGASMTYVEFFVASNPACRTSLERLKDLTSKLGTKLRVIVVTREKEEQIAATLDPLLSPRMAVALDPEGRIFTAYGVSYVPFGVLTDARNRALWMGNSLQLNEQVIENSK